MARDWLKTQIEFLVNELIVKVLHEMNQDLSISTNPEIMKLKRKQVERIIQQVNKYGGMS